MSDRKDGGPAFLQHIMQSGKRIAYWPAWKIAAMRANDALLSEREGSQ